MVKRVSQRKRGRGRNHHQGPVKEILRPREYKKGERKGQMWSNSYLPQLLIIVVDSNKGNSPWKRKAILSELSLHI